MKLKQKNVSQLTSLLAEVKEEKLDLPHLELLRDKMVHLFSLVMLERADLRKKEAFYFADEMNKDPNASDASIKRRFRVTADGQRLLELEAYKAILPREMDSLKSRIYAQLTPH